MIEWPSSSLSIEKVFASPASGTDPVHARKDAIRMSLELEADVLYNFNGFPYEIKYTEVMGCAEAVAGKREVSE